MIANKTRMCPGCRATSSTALGQANGFDLCSCAHCGTVFTAGLPIAGQRADYEAFYGESRNAPIPDFVLGRLEATAASLESYRTHRNRWLDIGCGAGTLLRAVANQGWDGMGTEVAPAAVEAVQAAGLKALLGESGDLDLPPEHFDVVSMVEVVEHVADVDALLEDAARLVRPGGALYLTTPHGQSLSARLLRIRWSVMTPPDHLQLFSGPGMRAALDRAGWHPVSVVTHGVNPYEISSGLRSGRDREGTPTNTETSYRLNETLSTRQTGTVIKRAVNAALSATRLGDTLKVVAERVAA